MRNVMGSNEYNNINAFSGNNSVNNIVSEQPILSSNLNGILQALSQEHIQLFLDIDGTLSEFHPDPNQSYIHQNVLAKLDELTQYVELTLVTGRSVNQAMDLIRPYKFNVVGSHGIEYYTTQEPHYHSLLNVVPSQFHQLKSMIEEKRTQYPHIRVEVKSHSVALHYREYPELQPKALQIVNEALLHFSSHFELKLGKCVYELVPCGANKGAAIQHILKNNPTPPSQAIFIGDDLTDEAGFITINQNNGLSIKVGQGSTHARFRLHDVSEVHHFLEVLAQHLKA